MVLLGFGSVLESVGRSWRVLERLGMSRKVLFQVQICLFKSNKNFKAFAIITTIFLSILNIEIARSYNIQSNRTG